MKIALASALVKNLDIDFNLQAIVDAMAACSGKADLILFGESVLQGFDCLCWEYEKDRHTALALTDDPIKRLCAAAKEYKIAVSFGFIEHGDNVLYSSQLFIGADGQIVDVFHRVSIGWKEPAADEHYIEGTQFNVFEYGGKKFATGLCGDLWTEGRPEEMKALNADVVLWPVWCDYSAEEWNTTTKYEYAEQAQLCGDHVLFVNPFCADETEDDAAAGGVAYFNDGRIVEEAPCGKSGILIVEL